jgi:hypothetical protein
MSDIPEAYQRIRESRVESIIKKHVSIISEVSSWLFGVAFRDATLRSVHYAELHVDRDHRRDSGDDLAYGETGIEVVATIDFPYEIGICAALLIETKVDARQMEKQGLRYRARATYRKQRGSWKDFRCVLVAPQRYLESAYPLGDFNDYGWNRLVALEDIAQRLERMNAGSADSVVLHEAAKPANAWNKPIPGAAQFWSDLARFQRAVYPNVPIFINRQQGAGVFVWPSFYENQLAKNQRAIRRKRVQIVHSGKSHVALYIKNVLFKHFEPVVRPILVDGIRIGAPGAAWQSVNIEVPFVSPQLPLEGQAERLDQVFSAARQLFDFFEKHENALLGIPIFK